MKLLVNTAAYWPTEEIYLQKTWLYQASCRKFGITPLSYGIGATRYEGNGAMRMDGQLDFLLANGKGYTHVLFTDSWDVLFVAPLSEIISKYENMGSPPLLMNASSKWAVNDPPIYVDAGYDESTPYRYPVGAAYIGEVQHIIDNFSRMDRSIKADQAYAYNKAWKEGWFRPVMDNHCYLFQDNVHFPDRDVCMIRDGRIYNPLTETFPSVIHLADGGYTNPETGKDDRIRPWAERLNII